MTVDDSEFERKIILGFLKNGGYKDAIEADSAEKAIEIFKKQKPDLVLVDVRLPKMDGVSCLRELKKINKDVKVIMLTIVLRKETIDEAIKLGAVDYLVKDNITLAVIVEKVSHYLNSKTRSKAAMSQNGRSDKPKEASDQYYKAEPSREK